MSSKISGFDTRSGAVGAGRAVEPVRGATTGPRNQPESATSGGVHITGTARQLVDLEQGVKDLPAVDQAKVSAISAALAEGSYKIVPQHIADELANMEQALSQLGEQDK